MSVKILSPSAYMSLADRRRAYRSMLDTVTQLHGSQSYTALLIVILCFLDALAGGTKRKYLRLLRGEFPDLCREIPAADFYESYRNAMIHEFSFRNDHGIITDEEADGQYVRKIRVKGSRRVVTGLNIDRFAQDVVSYLKGRIASLP